MITDQTVITNKEIHELLRFSELNGKANIVLDIERTPIGNKYRIATQSDYIKSMTDLYTSVPWKDITSYEEW